MYSQNQNQSHDGAVKHVIVFLLILFSASGILMWSLAGNFNPVVAAQGKQLEAQTKVYEQQAEADAERAPVDLDMYRQREQLKVDIERAQRIAQLEYEKAQYAQKLAQAQTDFENEQQRKDWSVMALVSLSLAAVIGASAFGYRQIKQARINAQRNREIYQALQALRKEIDLLDKRVSELSPEEWQRQHEKLENELSRLSALQNEHNGYGGNGANGSDLAIWRNPKQPS